MPDAQVSLGATVADTEGNVSDVDQISFTIDTVLPEIIITAPGNNLITNAAQVDVTGTVSEPVPTLTLNANGNLRSIQADQNNAFNESVDLLEGNNQITVAAADAASNQGSASVSVMLDTQVPSIPNAEFITISSPENGEVIVTGLDNSVEPNSQVTITNTRTGQSIVVTANASGAFIVSIAAEVGDVIQVVVTDSAGNMGGAVDLPPITNISLPPDPATVAPALNLTEKTPFADATSFLYSGNNPIQTGVAVNTIEPIRAAIIRGKVLNKQNNPLSGVIITIKDHPEFGQTLSRADGMFDMAINGGGYITIDYQKSGYLPAQRQINTPWRDFVFTDDVVMLQLDAQVTTVDLTRPNMQIAQGSTQTDADGSRQATLLFPQGTTASMTMADGTVQALTTLKVRATEYTVGENGRQSMPAQLPPTSGYTYAVELSIDEAIAVNAVKVEFNQAIPLYVENFLDFPVGGIVPLGYYDREDAKWKASDNGRVIQILSIANGVAELDVDGSGSPADANQLAELGINDTERQQLATLYSVGQSLWRSPVTHFTPWDCNWPYGPPDDAEPPKLPKPDIYNPESGGCGQDGSIIECQNRVLGERIEVTDTPFSLNYRSDRVPQHDLIGRVTIPVTGATVPPGVKYVELNISVGGTQKSLTFPNSPNQSYNFIWDGKDGYGRILQGNHIAKIQVANVYNAVYYQPADFPRAFDKLPAGTLIGSNRQGGEIKLRQGLTSAVNVTAFGGYTATHLGMGGWTIDQHHFYDTVSHELYLGDGKRIESENLSQVLNLVAGGFGPALWGGEQPAKETSFGNVWGIDVGTDSSIYFIDHNIWNFLQKVRPDGIAQSLAGQTVFNGDPKNGGPAVEAYIGERALMAVGPDDSIYFPDTDLNGNTVIRRITPDGIVDIFAGGGDPADGIGDGLPARGARIIRGSLDVGPDGSVYLGQRTSIRQIGTDGIIHTVAGDPNGSTADGVPARQAKIDTRARASNINLGPDGSIYFIDFSDPNVGERIRRITPDGFINTVAGGGNPADGIGDGELATDARIQGVNDLAIAADGSIYITQQNTTRGGLLRHVSPAGFINTIAGGGNYRGVILDKQLATRLLFGGSSTMRGIDIGPDGKIYLNIHGNQRSKIYTLDNVLPGFTTGEIIIPSKDGSELYRFNNRGRHLETFDAITNNIKYKFFYDTNGLLTEIHDRDGDITQLVRDAGGKLQSIVSEDGISTGVTINSDYLQKITQPDAAELNFEYTAKGQLIRFEDARGNVSNFTYDPEGYLKTDTHAGGSSWTLARTKQGDDYIVSMTSALNRTSSYQVVNSNTSTKRYINTLRDGGVIETEFQPNGTNITTRPNGTTITTVHGPDGRFGMQAPIPESATVQTPGGLTATTLTGRAVVLANTSDLLSLTNLSETMSVNGRNFETQYDAVTQTFTGLSAQGRIATRTINNQNRPLATQIAGLAPVVFEYDTRGRLAQMIGGENTEQRATTFGYYGSGPQTGYLQSITDAENRTIQFEHDQVGRITRQTLPDNRAINYSYDASGNLTSITPPGQPAHTFNYNAFDLEGQYTPPVVSGVTTPQTVYAYNLDKELELVTRPDGQVLDFQYNATTGQLDSVLIPGGSYQYIYLPSSGQLNTIVSPDAVTLGYGYDGFLLTDIDWSGAVAGSLDVTYNNDFLISQRCVNTTSCISFAYDNDNLLTGAGLLSLSRDPQRGGLITDTTLSDTTTSRIYNSFGELESVDANYNTTDLYGAVYTHDNLGRISTKIETVQGVTSNESYDYDLAGRLETVTRNGVITSYDYDDNGNRLSRTQSAAVEIGVYDDQDRLTAYGACDYTYSANGELQSKTCGADVTTYSYDVLGNLQTVSLPNGDTIDYIIDGQNRRVGKQLNGASTEGWLYQDQLNPIAELNPDGSIRSRFVYADKNNVPSYMLRDNITYRIISDHLGSPRLVINTSDGTVAQRMDYDEFGRVISDTNPGFQPFGFAGGLYDLNDGVVCDLVRGTMMRKAEGGTAKDPIRFDGGLNLYGYAINDPINFVDPDGENPRTWAQIILALITLMSGGPDHNPDVGDVKGRREPTQNEQVRDHIEKTRERSPKQQKPPKNPEPRTSRELPRSNSLTLLRWIRIGTGIGLALYPSSLGCSSFDCNNNGIPDAQETGCL